MSKSILRYKTINLRKLKNQQDIKINVLKFFKFFKKLNYKKKIFGGYYPINYEMNILHILKELEMQNVKVSLPITKKNNEMDFYQWSTTDILILNKFGIPEPQKIKKVIPDILLIPYDTDFTIKGGSKALEYSSPIKLFEYLSSGKPIIASNLPSISRILSDGSDSILVNPDSFNDLNTALSSLLASKELSSRISEKSLKLSRQFTWVGRAKRMLLPKN